MSRQTHLDRGYCCENSCVYCPYRPAPVFAPDPPDSRILAALLSGDAVTIESGRMSLVPTVVLQGRVIINYQPFVAATNRV